MAEPIIDSNNPEDVISLLNTLKRQRQALLRRQWLVENPTPEMKTWSPRRLATFATVTESSLRANTSLIERGEAQLATLKGTSNVRQATEQTTSNTTSNNAVDQAKLNSLRARKQNTTVNDDGSYDKVEQARLTRHVKTTVGQTPQEKVVGGGSTTAGYGQSNGTYAVPNSSKESNSYNDAPGKRPKNPLAEFSSYNYLITLYMVTPEEHSKFLNSGRTFLDTTSDGVYVVAQSGGLNNEDSTRLPELNFDYYIDDLKFINTLAGENNTSTATYDWNFNIIEPYGFSFITKLAEGYEKVKTKTNIGNVPNVNINATKGFFIIAIRFYGYDADGKLIIKKEIPYERFYDIFLREVKFTVDGRATIYRIKAADVGQSYGMGTTKGQVNHITKVKAKNVFEAFKGTDGLFTKLNEQQKKLTEIKDANGSPVQRYANEYDIVFEGPDAERIQNSDIIELDRALVPMSIAKNVEYVNDGTSSKSVPDFVNKTFTVDSGTPILQAIENIVVRSKYIQDAMKATNESNEEPNKNGETASNTNPRKVPLKWIRVTCKATAIKADESVNDYAMKLTFIVTSYEIPMNNNAYASTTTPYPGPYKRYEYWLTGENTEIRKFEQTLDNLYYLSYVTGQSNSGSSTTMVPGQKLGQNVQGKKDQNMVPESSVLTSLQDMGSWARSRITILGDPDYLMQPYSRGSKYYGSDGYSINPNNAQVFIEINFHEAVDYNYDNDKKISNDTGLLTVNKYISFYMPSVKGVPPGLKGLSFLVWKCTSTFSKGIFTQELELSLNQFPNGSVEQINQDNERKTESETERENKSLTGRYPPPTPAQTNGLKTDKQTPNNSVPTVQQKTPANAQNSNQSSTKDDAQLSVNNRLKIAFGLQEGRESESLINRLRSRLGIPIGGFK